MGVARPISLQRVVNEFGGPGRLSAYHVGSGYVRRHERNFFIPTTTDTSKLSLQYFDRETYFGPAGIGTAERNFTSEFTIGNGNSVLLGNASYGWEFNRFGDLYPITQNDPSAVEVIGLNSNNDDIGFYQGISTKYYADPFDFNNYFILLFYCYSDIRISSYGSNWWNSMQIYGPTGALSFQLDRTSFDNPNGDIAGEFPYITYWTTTIFDDGSGSNNPIGGFSGVSRLKLNIDALSGGSPPLPPAPSPSPSPTPPSPPEPPPPGCPLCCFTPETLITMADHSYKRIDQIEIGDAVLSFNSELGINESKTITEIITRVNRVMFEITFDNSKTLNASDDHPLYVVGKGYASINPQPSYKDLKKIEQLNIGDYVIDSDGEEHQIMELRPIDYPETVYTFAETKFYANGILVY